MNASDPNLSTFERLDFASAPEADIDPSHAPLVPSDAAFLADVNVGLEARLGGADVSVKDLLSLKPGSVVTLNESLGELVELRLNQTVVARGELVAVGDRFAVRIVEVHQRR